MPENPQSLAQQASSHDRAKADTHGEHQTPIPAWKRRLILCLVAAFLIVILWFYSTLPEI